MPLAVTDNLNFGNPYKPENFWQLRECVEGLAEACRAFGTPVTGGNVSLYNESPAGAIDPTPTVGMVGLIEDESHVTTQFFRQAGDVILLLGGSGHELGGSQYLAIVHGRKEGAPPRLDLVRELALHDAVRGLIRRALVQSAHDCSEGGLAVALAECCISGSGRLGALVHLPADGTTPAQQLFNESQSRILLSVRRENVDAVLDALRSQGVPVAELGEVGGPSLQIHCGTAPVYAWTTAALREVWYDSIARCMEAA